MQLHDLGLSEVKIRLTGTQLSRDVVLREALDAARGYFTEREVSIPENAIYTVPIHVLRGQQYLGCHLWNLLIDYFKIHYSGKKPLVPSFFLTKMKNYLEGKNIT